MWWQGKPRSQTRDLGHPLAAFVRVFEAALESKDSKKGLRRVDAPSTHTYNHCWPV